MRFAAIVIALLCSTAAAAEVSCDQLVAISQKTVDLRNSGAPLSAILADMERPEMKQRFTPTELDFIRLLVQESFMGAYSPFDVKEACEDGRLAIPVRKGSATK